MFFSRKKNPKPPRKAKLTEETAEPSFIGRNTAFEGHVVCDGELHVDGTVRGTVQAGLCVVDGAGVIHGSLTADVVHVRGRVLGPIHGLNVFIHAGAHVEGDVFNDTISIENGAYVYGSIRHNAAPAPRPPQAPILTPTPLNNMPPASQPVVDIDFVDGSDQNARVIKMRK